MAFTILVVEDDTDVREALVEALAEHGYDVTSAADGREALAALRAGARPGLILLDLMMPRMNGTEFRAAQRRDAALARIPVVLLSADALVAEKAAALEVASYVRKPIDFGALLDLIEGFATEGKSVNKPGA
jgi:two-component system response regulator MprA